MPYNPNLTISGAGVVSVPSDSVYQSDRGERTLKALKRIHDKRVAEENEMKLSEELKLWRADRPDEWKMDEFIRKAEGLEDCMALCVNSLPDMSRTEWRITDYSASSESNCNYSFLVYATISAVREAEGSDLCALDQGLATILAIANKLAEHDTNFDKLSFIGLYKDNVI